MMICNTICVKCTKAAYLILYKYSKSNNLSIAILLCIAIIIFEIIENKALMNGIMFTQLWMNECIKIAEWILSIT